MTELRLTNYSLTLTETLIENLTLGFLPGWTGITGPNGCGKTSLALHIRAALTGRPERDLPGESSGRISGPGSVSYMGQLPGTFGDEQFAVLAAADNRDRRLLALLEVGEDWPYRFEELSWGERRRLQLACTLLTRPEVLILDEPENHLDLTGRELIIRALREFEGIGIIIGHSRDIMNALCSSTLFLFQRRWHYYPHPLGESLDIYEREEAALREKRDRLGREIQRQSRTLQDYRGHAARASAALSKKGLSRHDSDARAAIDLGRISGADKASSRKVAIQKNRIDASRRRLEEISVDGIRKTGLTIREEPLRREILFLLPAGVREPYPGFRLALPELKIRRQERIILRGPNGSGKTTLLRLIFGELNRSIPCALIPQEFSPDERRSILRDLELRKDRGELLAYFSRLGGDPEQLTEERAGSPGELKKLALAAAFLEGTALLILDEPANHLDIFSVRILEEALGAYRGALLMVSHEREFCRNRITRVWEMEDGRLSIQPAGEMET